MRWHTRQNSTSTGCSEIVVVAAHPDDETLGFGAALATLAHSGVRVQVVVASDGGASHQDRFWIVVHLERTRRAELHDAVRVLGVPAPICLGMPDGDLGEPRRSAGGPSHRDARGPARHTWIAATWRGDGHPDHEAVGRAAAVAAQRSGAVLLEYPIWMWHWATPGDTAVPWDRLRALPRSRACHRPEDGGRAVLPLADGGGRRRSRRRCCRHSFCKDYSPSRRWCSVDH